MVVARWVLELSVEESSTNAILIIKLLTYYCVRNLKIQKNNGREDVMQLTVLVGSGF